ncbi:MAG: hypothetical protein E7K47_18125, partial [Acidovorax sp.]|nr:hypothetical protein [Acidovorax sp.]
RMCLGLTAPDEGSVHFHPGGGAAPLAMPQDALALAQDAQLRPLARRVEVSGETVFFYTQDARPLLQALSAHGSLRTLHRPANLEDLFLKLTGRQIREEG